MGALAKKWSAGRSCHSATRPIHVAWTGLNVRCLRNEDKIEYRRRHTGPGNHTARLLAPGPGGAKSPLKERVPEPALNVSPAIDRRRPLRILGCDHHAPLLPEPPSFYLIETSCDGRASCGPQRRRSLPCADARNGSVYTGAVAPSQLWGRAYLRDALMWCRHQLSTWP